MEKVNHQGKNEPDRQLNQKKKVSFNPKVQYKPKYSQIKIQTITCEHGNGAILTKSASMMNSLRNMHM